MTSFDNHYKQFWKELHAVMSGAMQLRHPSQVWRSKESISSIRSFFVHIRSNFCLTPPHHPESPKPELSFSPSSTMPASSSSQPQPAGGKGSTAGGAKGIKGRLIVTMRHAISLITARLSFFGQRAGAAATPITLPDDKKFYLIGDKVWRTKTHSEVPAGNHSVTDVQNYVRELPQNRVVDYTEA